LLFGLFVDDLWHNSSFILTAQSVDLVVLNVMDFVSKGKGFFGFFSS